MASETSNLTLITRTQREKAGCDAQDEEYGKKSGEWFEVWTPDQGSVDIWVGIHKR
jgi:hypothetical protein